MTTTAAAVLVAFEAARARKLEAYTETDFNTEGLQQRLINTVNGMVAWAVGAREVAVRCNSRYTYVASEALDWAADAADVSMDTGLITPTPWGATLTW